MTVAAAPVVSSGEPGETRKSIESLCRRAASVGADLLLLPEAALTGYDPARAEELAVSRESREIQHLIRLADSYGFILSCGFMERLAGGGLALTQLITDGNKTQFYRKTHLGCRERTLFVPGNELPVFETESLSFSQTADSGSADYRENDCVAGHVVIGTQLCWEAHIPEISGVLRAKGAEILLIPYASGFSGEKCREIWDRFLAARASDNGCYVIACNAGSGCAVYDPKGRRIASDFSSGSAQTPDDTEAGTPHLLVCEFEPDLPRWHADGDMKRISYFDRRRPELYSELVTPHGK